MTIKFLKRVVEDVIEGQSEQLVDLLLNKKDVNEFIIAKKLNLTINQTRNLLYKFSNLGILNSVRKKDKRKGWYIYFWTLNLLKSLEILEKKIEDEIFSFEQELLRRQQSRFYKCKICGVELNEEAAILSNFGCQECGEVYELANNKPYIEEVIKKISKLRKDLNLVSEERQELQKKEDKKLSDTIKRKERERKSKMKKNREKNKKIKENLLKKKKIPKKSKKQLKTKKKKI